MPAGDDGQVQFNDNGAFGASQDFVWDNTGHQIRLGAEPNDNVEIRGNAPGVQVAVIAADGDATHPAGELSLLSGDGVAGSAASGGNITVAAGHGIDDVGGNISIESGTSAEWDGGDINIRANEVSAGHNGGDINIVAGQGANRGGNVTVQGGGSDGNVQLYSGDGNQAVQLDNSGLSVLGKVGFYGHAAVDQQTGVAVSAAAIHAALVNLGLITA